MNLPAIRARIASGESQASIAKSLRVGQSTLNRALSPSPKSEWLARLIEHPPRAWTHAARRATPAFATRTANALRAKYPQLEWCVVACAVWARRPMGVKR